MRVWLTRSEPGASRVGARLVQAGHLPVVAPVVSIEAVAHGNLDPAVTDTIFLSEHAVGPGLDAIRCSGVEAGRLRTFAVGPHTAARLADAGVRALVPPVASTEGLLTMPQLGDVTHRRIVVMCGEGGRELLQEALAERGARVSRHVVYRRRPVSQESLVARIDPSRIDVVAVSSGDGFRWAAKVWFAAQGSADVAVVAPSERVAALGALLGFTRVTTSAGAGADALIEALANWVS